MLSVGEPQEKRAVGPGWVQGVEDSQGIIVGQVVPDFLSRDERMCNGFCRAAAVWPESLLASHFDC